MHGEETIESATSTASYRRCHHVSITRRFPILVVLLLLSLFPCDVVWKVHGIKPRVNKGDHKSKYRYKGRYEYKRSKFYEGQVLFRPVGKGMDTILNWSTIPRDWLQGVKILLSNTFKTTLIGLKIFFDLPFIGIASYPENKFFGCTKGLFQGLLNVLLWPSIGVLSGLYKLFISLKNTPHAIICRHYGLVWYDGRASKDDFTDSPSNNSDDEYQGWIEYFTSWYDGPTSKDNAADSSTNSTDHDYQGWIEYFIHDEIETLTRQLNFADKKNKGSDAEPKNGHVQPPRRKHVKNTTYYDLLDVPLDATSSQIKRAYYKKAKQLHPDKNPNNAQAEDDFRNLSLAYEVLSNGKLRREYDRTGRRSDDKGTSGDEDFAKYFWTNVDTYVFCSFLFGSDSVQPYVGELWIASIADTLSKIMFEGAMEDGEIDFGMVRDLQSANNKRQRLRTAQVAEHLQTRIQGFVQGDVSDIVFKHDCRKEATKIAATTFGSHFLIRIGKSVELTAKEYRGYHKPWLGILGYPRTVQKQWRLLGERLDIVKFFLLSMVGIVQLFLALLEISAHKNRYPEDIFFGEERIHKIEDKGIEQAILMLWAITQQDVTTTLYKAVNKVFLDASLPYPERVKRAEALELLGHEFYMVGMQGMEESSLSNKSKVAEELRQAAERLAVAVNKAFTQGYDGDDADEFINEYLNMAR